MRWALGLALALGLVAPASAATIIATYSGSVLQGTDNAGLFGAAGANLAGDIFDVVFTFDAAKGTLTPGGIEGGPPSGNSPAVDVTLTINGQQYEATNSLVSNLTNLIITSPLDGSVETTESFANARWSGFPDFELGFFGSPSTGTTYSNAPGVISASSPTPGIGCFGNSCGEVGVADGEGFDLATQSFSVTGVTVTPAPLPEPSAWLELLAGVALLGAAFRARRKISSRSSCWATNL